MTSSAEFVRHLYKWFSARRGEPVRIYVTDVQTRRARLLQWAVFCFLYIPLVYWSGLALHAKQVTDYPGYYIAAHSVFIDHTSPYGFDALDSWAQAFKRWMPPYVYPPPSILAFWPLTLLSFGGGFVAFTLISHLCLLGCMWLMIMRLHPLPAKPLVRTVFICLATAYVLLSDAVRITLDLGQVNLIVLFLLCASFVALERRGSNWLIAAPLSIAILLKTYPLFLLILIATRRRFKAAALTLACFAALVAIAVVVVPSYVWSSWLTEVVPAASNTKALAFLFSHTPLDFAWNQSVAGLMKRLLGDTLWGHSPLSFPALAAPLTKVVDAALIGVTSFLAFRFYKRCHPMDGLADDTAAFLLMMYLVSPISWDHHLVFILPAAILALRYIVEERIHARAALGLAAVLCLLAWRVQLDASLFQKGWWNLLGFVKFYAVAALWIFFSVRLARASSRVAEESPVPAMSQTLQPQL